MGAKHMLCYLLQQRSYCLSCWIYNFTTKQLTALFSLYDTLPSKFYLYNTQRNDDIKIRFMFLYFLSLFTFAKYMLYITTILLNTFVHKLRSSANISKASLTKMRSHLHELLSSVTQILIRWTTAMSERNNFYISTPHYILTHLSLPMHSLKSQPS